MGRFYLILSFGVLFLNSIQTYSNSKKVLTIPIVFHVLWENESEQIPTLGLIKLLELVTNEYNCSSQNLLTGVRPMFHEVTGTPKIEFVLAQKAEGNLSVIGVTQKRVFKGNYNKNNIEKIKTDSVIGTLPWNIKNCINVWVCKINSMNPNFQRYSGITASMINTESNIPGVVIDYRDILKPNVLIHELGHYFGLKHTWGSKMNTCDSDDGFIDTPFCQRPAISCRNPISICDSVQQWENWMDYSFCSVMFTKEQCLFMRNTMNIHGKKMIKEGRRLKKQALLDGVSLPSYGYSYANKFHSLFVINNDTIKYRTSDGYLFHLKVNGNRVNKISFLRNKIGIIDAQYYSICENKNKSDYHIFTDLKEETQYGALKISKGLYYLRFKQTPKSLKSILFILEIK